MMKKRGIGLDYLTWLIIGVTTLIVVTIGFLILRRSGSGAIEEILRNLF